MMKQSMVMRKGAADAYSRESDPCTLVTYDVFANEIWPKMVKGKSLYNPALVWKEKKKSFLKGSFEALNFTEGRSEIYRLFCLYHQIRSQRGYFGEDLLYNLSQTVKAQ